MMIKQNASRSLLTTETPEKEDSGRRFRNMFRTRQKSATVKEGDDPKRFFTIGGVFHTDDETDGKPASTKSLHTVDTRSSDDSTSSAWSTSGGSNHHKGSPRIAKTFSVRRINPNNVELTEEQLVGRVMLRSRALPKTNGYFVGNHVMINTERTRRFVAPLTRMPDMDELARAQAKAMAEENQLFHTDPEDLRMQLVGRQSGRRIGENVTKGANVQEIHKFMMQSLADKNNILDRRYTFMGVGTAKAADGTLYLCQIFRD